MPRLTITDLGGSVVQGRPVAELDKSEWSELRNFYQFGGRLRRRGGIRRLTTSPFDEPITGLASYKPEILPPGGIDMVVGALTQLGILVGSSISPIPFQTGFSITSSTRRWVLFQYKNVLYGIREGANLVRSDGTYVGPGGIAAPLTAPTLADGAAGDIPAAAFRGVYTFYNPITNLESNPSPVSNVLTHAGSTKIDWSGIGISSNSQVTARRLYRSLPDQSGEYFRVATINNNTDTTFIGDNVLAQDLGDAVSFDNGEPPINLTVGDVWQERLFVTDGRDVFHSEDGLIEAFDPDSVIPVSPDDRHEIRAIRAYGDRVIFGKTNGIHYVTGVFPFSFGTLTDRHGCVSHHTMKVAEGYLLWLGPDNVYRSDGNNVTGIANVKLRGVIATLSNPTFAELARNATATVYPALGWYVLSFGFADWIYNYRTDVWCSVTRGDGSPSSTAQAYGDFFTGDAAQHIYITDDAGHVYRFHDTDYGFDDSASALGSPIVAHAETRGFADAATKHIIERVSLLTPFRYSEMITLGIVSAPATWPSGAVKSRTVSLDYEPDWKLYSLSTRHAPQSMSQLHIEYSGETAIEIDGYAFDIYPLNRPTMLAR